MIYECNGIMGTGKTSLTNQLSKNILKESKFIGVRTFRGAKKSKISKSLLIIKRVLLLVKPSNLSIIKLCVQYLRSGVEATQKIYTKREIFISLLYCVYIYDNYRTNEETLICDEGFIQSIATFSLMHQGDLKYVYLMINLFDKLPDRKCLICCNLPINDALVRIKARDRHDSAVDTLNIMELTEFLRSYQQRLNDLRQKISYEEIINIEMNNSVEILANMISKLKVGK